MVVQYIKLKLIMVLQSLLLIAGRGFYFASQVRDGSPDRRSKVGEMRVRGVTKKSNRWPENIYSGLPG
jgi:hypothetical protein